MAIVEKTVLIIVTSCDTLRSGRKTGLWFDEFAIPYIHFKEQGYRITVASPLGGNAPIDAQSLNESILHQGHVTPRGYAADNADVMAALNNTTTLSFVDTNNTAVLYIPGGNGTMVDLQNNHTLNQILLHRHNTNQLIATLCHGAICLTSLMIEDTPLVQQRKLTCFSDAEEMQTGFNNEYDFLLETRLRELGAEVTVNSLWSENVVVDDNLITGQNPQSCERLAKIIINLTR